MPIQQRYLEQLIAEDVVHESEPGRYWLDLDAYRELQRRKFFWTMWILALAAVAFLIVFVVQHFAGR